MKTVNVAASRHYQVKIGSSLLKSLGTEAQAFGKGKALVVTDENVAPLYLAAAYRSLKEAGFAVCTLSLPAGERTKSPEYYLKLLNLLAEKQFSRSDLLIALGGGVVGDLTGFTAVRRLFDHDCLFRFRSRPGTDFIGRGTNRQSRYSQNERKNTR